MTKFIKLKRKNLSAVMVKGIRFKFSKDKKSGKIHLILSIGEEIQKHLKIVAGDKLILGYGEENPYEIQLLKAAPNDLDAFKLSKPAGTALSISFPWDVSNISDEVSTQRSQEAIYDLPPDCVILNIVLRFDEKIH